MEKKNDYIKSTITICVTQKSDYKLMYNAIEKVSFHLVKAYFAVSWTQGI